MNDINVKKINIDNKKLITIAALLVNAAKIDEQYTNKEKEIILSFINIFHGENKEEILKKAEELENNSNQLLSFTNAIKKESIEFKTLIIKELWKIILSDDKNDLYESNLIRKICGLIYFPDKLSGEIKLQLTDK
tara:strand:+ start:2735 stop:3139 length:405 start_codon:yes stop_codon:yes gene_type:complete